MCEACKAALEDKFQEVKEYVRNNKEAYINQIAEDCDVSVKQIKQWIREERLILTENSNVYIECENCGAAIRMGRFCEDCKNKMRGDLRSMYEAESTEAPKDYFKAGNKNKMRFLDS
jgi:ribosomal protein L32